MILRFISTLAIVAALATPALAEPKCFASPGETVSGAITHYVDGDTFDIGRDRIRPWGIDATERGEFGYAEATQTLRTLTRGRSLSCTVKYRDTTPAQRCVAVCEVSEIRVGDLGEIMLRSGWVKSHRRPISKFEAAI